MWYKYLTRLLLWLFFSSLSIFFIHVSMPVSQSPDTLPRRVSSMALGLAPGTAMLGTVICCQFFASLRPILDSQEDSREQQYWEPCLLGMLGHWVLPMKIGHPQFKRMILSEKSTFEHHMPWLDHRMKQLATAILTCFLFRKGTVACATWI